MLLLTCSLFLPLLRPPNIRILAPQTTRGQLPQLASEHANKHQLRHPRSGLALYAGLLSVGRSTVRRDTAHTASDRSARLGHQVLRVAAQPARDVRVTLGRLVLGRHERLQLFDQRQGDQQPRRPLSRHRPCVGQGHLERRQPAPVEKFGEGPVQNRQATHIVLSALILVFP